MLFIIHRIKIQVLGSLISAVSGAPVKSYPVIRKINTNKTKLQNIFLRAFLKKYLRCFLFINSRFKIQLLGLLIAPVVETPVKRYSRIRKKHTKKTKLENDKSLNFTDKNLRSFVGFNRVHLRIAHHYDSRSLR